MAKAKKSAKKAVAKKAPAQKKPVAKKSAPKKAVPKKAAKKSVAIKKPAAKALPKVASKSTPKSSPQKSINLSPLSDRIVVRVEGPSERTAGGLYIPASVEDRPHQGQVLACGPGSKSKKGHLKPLDVKKGDVVLFSPYAGTKTEISGEEVLILREEEVLGVIA